MNMPQEIEEFMGDKINKAYSILNARRNAMQNICSEENKTKELKTISMLSMHNNGAYILKDDSIFHGETVGDNIYYHDLANKDHSYISDKNVPIASNVLNKDSNTGRIEFCDDILTGQHLYAVRKDGKLVFECSGIEIPDYVVKSQKKSSISSDGKDIFIIEEHVQDYFSSRGRRYPAYNTFYHALDKNGDEGKAYSRYTELLKELLPKGTIMNCKYCFHDDIYKYLVGDSIKLKSDEEISPIRSSYTLYFKDDVFYMIKDGYAENDYSIVTPASEHDGIKYCVIGNTIFYCTDKEKGYKCINSIYALEPICGKYIILDGKGGVIFMDEPFHKYGVVQGNKIIEGNKTYCFDFSKTTVESGEVTESDYPITKVVAGKPYLVYPFFVFIDGESDTASIFYKTEEIHSENVLKQYKNFRFERRKSDFFLNRDTGDVYTYSCDSNLHILPAKEYSIKSLKLISEQAVAIEGLDGKLYCVNYIGKKQEISPLDEYQSFYGDDNITGLKKDGTIEINGSTLKYNKNKKTISKMKKVIWPNVEFIGNMRFISKEPVEDCTSCAIVNFTNAIAYVNFTGETMHQDEYFDCYKNDSGIHAYIKKEGYPIEISSSELDWIRQDSQFVPTARGYIINGYHIVSSTLSTIERYNSSIFNSLIEASKKLKNAPKNALENSIKDIAFDSIIKFAGENDVNISKDDILNSPSLKDTLLVLLNIKNIKEHCPIGPKELLLDIENSLKDRSYDFTKSDYFKSINVINDKSYIKHGLSIEKFNDYTGKVGFVSTTSKNKTLKDSLCNTLFTQLYNLLGSRKKKIDGVLQLTDINTLISVESDIDDEIADTIKAMNDSEKKEAVKFLNGCGYRLYNILKKYIIKIDYSNLRIIINNRMPENVHISKLKSIANDITSFGEKVTEDINNSNMNEDLKKFVAKYIEWSIKHISDDFWNVKDDSTDFKEKTFTIKLWNRKDLILNLTQGNKTHCCIAADNYNIGALIRYIYNKNVNLVEIRHKNDVVGQAFVYLGISKNRILYRYDDKYHIFMAIDNVEVNNNYSPYSEDIAKYLQKFMIQYKDYVSSDISDVLLGVNYNDIEPPYEFKADIGLAMIGQDHYRDSADTFYKFI